MTLRFHQFLCLAIASSLYCLAIPDVVAGQQQSDQNSGDMKLPDISGPKPWSDKPVLNDAERFSIAIMTDRTGGHRPGIWMKGVDKVNLMRPDFVVSVGDLIEGYTEDTNRIEAEWKEFLGFIDKMQMRFFFVPGNHDLINPVMHRIWKQKFGREWYSFDYKGVHFVCLNSEDPVSRIGDDQLDWIRKDLAKHRDARWTLVFLHKPLWTYSENARRAGNEDRTNWKPIQDLLQDRKHTVFAGHVHHYVQYDRNGSHYYSLATTGGGSRLRGKSYGEFDHVVWLTMEKDGPRVANLMLDGIDSADVVTEKSIGRFREFLAKATFDAAPLFIDNASSIQSGEIKLSFTNAFDRPVRYSGRLSGIPLKGLDLQPEQINVTIQPGDTVSIPAKLKFTESVSLRRLANSFLNVNIFAEDDRPLRAELRKPLIIDQRLRWAQRDIKIDGKLDDWAELPFFVGDSADVFGNQEKWQGTNDGSIKFGVAMDDNQLSIGAEIRDDKILANDRLSIVIDPRPFKARIADQRLRWGILIELGPTEDGKGVEVKRTLNGRRPLDGLVAKVEKQDESYQLELSIPRSALGDLTQEGGGFQLGVAAIDVDDENEPPAILSWRGARNFRRSNERFGHFFSRN